VIPSLVRRLGIQKTHLVCLWLGGAGLISMRYFSNPDSLLVSMIGVGFAWASIVSMPYALLAGSVPSRKMGVYMGIFNFFIVIPQLVIGTVTRTLLEKCFDGQAIYVLVVGGVSLLLAGVLALRVREPDLRTTRRVGMTLLFTGSPAIWRSRVSTSRSPARRVSCMTVVNGGLVWLAAGIS